MEKTSIIETQEFKNDRKYRKENDAKLLMKNK